MMLFLVVAGAVLLTTVVVLIVCRVKVEEEEIALKEDTYVLITGCDSGVGNALARHLQGRNGLHVIATCVWPDKKAAVELRALGVEVVGLDYLKHDTNEFCQRIRDILGSSKLHALINNAGVCIAGEFDWLTEDQVEMILRVNLGAVWLVKHLMDTLIKDQSRVINVTSVNGTLAYPGLAAYCASKYALEGFSDALAMEMAKFNVRVIKLRLGDFAKLTSIMDGQAGHASKMWRAFSERQRALYKAYFDDYHRVVSAEAGALSLPDFGGLMKCFDRALFSVQPASVYVCGKSSYLMVLHLLSWMPEVVRNRVVAWAFEKAWNRKLHKDYHGTSKAST